MNKNREKNNFYSMNSFRACVNDIKSQGGVIGGDWCWTGEEERTVDWKGCGRGRIKFEKYNLCEKKK